MYLVFHPVHPLVQHWRSCLELVDFSVETQLVFLHLLAMVTSFAVIAIANMGGKATSAKLILAGMAVSAVCSAFSNFVIYITNDKNAATEVMKWTMGSLCRRKLEQSRCNASCYIDLCNYFLDAIS